MGFQTVFNRVGKQQREDEPVGRIIFTGTKSFKFSFPSTTRGGTNHQQKTLSPCFVVLTVGVSVVQGMGVTCGKSFVAAWASTERLQKCDALVESDTSYPETRLDHAETKFSKHMWCARSEQWVHA